MQKILLFLGLLICISNTHAQTMETPVDDVSVIIYEKASRMGAIGDFLGGFISKDKSGQIYIDPFRLHPSKQNKSITICYVDKKSKEMTDDELIAMNLKSSLEEDRDFLEKVNASKVFFNKYNSYTMLGTGLANDECEYIAAASTELKEIDAMIVSVDSVIDKTFKPIEGFKVSSARLWEDPSAGKPHSRQDYLSLAWCGFPSASQKTVLQSYGVTTANGCKNINSEMVASSYALSDGYTSQKIVSYLDDRATGKKTNKSAEHVRMARSFDKYGALAKHISYKDAAYCVVLYASSVSAFEEINRVIPNSDSQNLSRASLAFMEIYTNIGVYHRDFNGVPQNQINKALFASTEAVNSMSSKERTVAYLRCLKKLADGTN